MRYCVRHWILSLFVLALSGGTFARADGSPSLDRILPQIRETHPGKFYNAQNPFRGSDGRLRYRLKWMTPDGRIVWFDADAHTGREIGPGSNFVPRERPPFREEGREERREQRRFEREHGGFPHEGRPRGHRR